MSKTNPDLKLCFVGDVVPDKPYHFAPTLEKYIKGHDIRVFNLEGAFSNKRDPLFKAGKHLLLDPEHLVPFSDCFNVAVLANNHAMDFGPEGLSTTQAVCRSHQLHTVGGGSNAEEAYMPLDIGNCRIIAVAENEFGAASIGAPGIAVTDNIRAILRRIKESRCIGKVTIVVAHGGTELIPMPPPYLRERYRLWIEHGADLVIGSHPHVVQGHEYFKGRHIFYSLGNFAFQAEHFKAYDGTDWSIIVSVDTSKGLIEVKPVTIDDGGILHFNPRKVKHQSYNYLCQLLDSPKYEAEFDRIAKNLYNTWYQRLAAKNSKDAALLLHYFRCDAHRHLIQYALSAISGERSPEQTATHKGNRPAIDHSLADDSAVRSSTVAMRSPSRGLKLEQPFLIVGAGSSGTTLLSVLLDRHPMVACGPELSVFNKRAIYGAYAYFQKKLHDWIDRGLSTDGQAEYREFFFNRDAYFHDRDQLVALAADCNCLRDFFDRFFEVYLKRRHKQIWGEKTGSNAYCLQEFKRLYPQAKIIHLVRDGRDVVCSLIKRPNNTPFHSASHWLYNVSASIAGQSLPGYLQIRYEDLVAQPDIVLQQICSHLAIPYDAGILSDKDRDDYWHSNQKCNVHQSWKNSPLSGKISTESVGRYSMEMTKDVSDLFWSLKLSPTAQNKLGVAHSSTREIMATLGYEHAPPQVDGVVAQHYIDASRSDRQRAQREMNDGQKHWAAPTYIA